jgi:exopolyphosphatase/guanosine-5'-triphosphate,3'-diphosphate pyrophosphatase
VVKGRGEGSRAGAGPSYHAAMAMSDRPPSTHGDASRVAVVDLGTNTTRLLVAEIRDGAVTELDRRTEITALGRRLDASGRLDDDAIERVMSTAAGYREAIDAAEVEATVAVATSAARDAANADELHARLRDELGLEVRTISGEEEARLTFLGATSRRAPPTSPTVVIDIGGGSTELVVGVPGEEPTFVVSTQAGSVRQTDRHLDHDPPSTAELAELREDAQAILADAVPVAVRGLVAGGIAVAGTATSLAAIDQALDPYDPERVDGYELDAGACERMLAMFTALPLDERREVTGLEPGRAPTIVAGSAILIEAMRAFDLASVTVSEADLLHGAALSTDTVYP